MNCGDLLSPLIESVIFEKDDAKTLIQNYFEVENLREIDDSKIQEFVATVADHPFIKGNAKRFQRLLKSLETIILSEAPLETSSKDASENIDIDEAELEKIYVHKDYTFISQTEAKNKLFKNNDHLLVKYEGFIQKFLLSNLFLNLRLPTLITSDEQMKDVLCQMINHLSDKLIGKPIFTFTLTAITPLYNNYYRLNYEINKILGDPQNLQHLNNLNFGQSTSELSKVMAAITLANFKTILSDYLPGILNINSKVPGLDLENINNKSIYTINTGSFLTDWTDQEKIVDRNSNLAKMILNFFDNVQVYERNGDISIRLLKEPIFSLANFYYISSILSNYINSNNYVNEFNQLLTALMLLRMRGVNNTTRLKDLEKTNRELIGKFDTEYLTVIHPELNKLLDERILFNLIGTLYYNMVLTENDPIFSVRTFSINESTWKEHFSLTKYYQKYSGQSNFGKQNLHSLLYSTFNGYSQRHYHDIMYDSLKGRIVSTPLSLSVVNREAFNMQKIHQNLISFNDTVKQMFISSIDKNGITFIVNNKDVRVDIVGGKWAKIEDESLKNKIEELFTQLTFVDISDPSLADSTNYSTSNLLDVIYAMINLHDRRQDNADLIHSKKRLEKAWNPFARKDSSGNPLNINSILYGMGAQYGLLNGILSRMTLINKEGAQLPTFGNVGLMYRYNTYLETLRQRSKDDILLNSNIFILNPNLFINVSSKNQLAVNENIEDFKSADERDQIITNVFYEYIQRRNSPTKLSNYLVDEEINYDGTIHFQPIVYADKTQQNVIAINANSNIRYVDKYGNNITISSFKLNSFDKDVVDELRKAAYHSIGLQHFKRFMKTVDGFNNILSGLNLTQPLTQENYLEESFKIITDYIDSVEKNTGIRPDLIELWRQFNPKEPLIENLYFEGKNKKYKLNNTLLFYYKLFDANTEKITENHKRYHNLGVLEFLTRFSKMNLDITSTNFKIFKNLLDLQNIISDINSINDKKIKKELEELLSILQNYIINPNSNSTPLEQSAWEQEYIKHNSPKNLIFSTDKDVNYFHQRLELFLNKNLKILQQFYWESELFGQNYELSVNGPIYLHALKGTTETLYLELVSRLAMSQKRNVTHQATVNPYGKNDIDGHAAIRKVVFVKEPLHVVNNPMGEKENLETHNGGEMILLLQRILENNSMLGFSNPLHHKSFIVGKTLNGNNDFVETILFKYASYALTNERIRSSSKYQNLIKFALTQEIKFLDKIDFTKDFRGNAINYGDFNIIEETATGWRRLLFVENLGNNNLKFTYRNNFKDFETETVTITSLYDLYKALGAHKTVSLKGDKIYENNNNSWEALLQLCNKVGFSLKNESEDVLLNYANLSGNSILEIKSLLNSVIDTQLNVAQPLKFAFVSQFTPGTAVKFGGSIGEDVNYFLNEKNPGELHPINVYDIILGVQLDSSHEGEESTEPTQMINGVALDNMSPELINLYKHKALYIILVMQKTYPDINFRTIDELNNDDDYVLDHCKQLLFIYDKLQSQILNSSYDNGQTASLVLISALNFSVDFKKLNGREDLSKSKKADLARTLLTKSFNVSLSHTSVNKIFITALAALNSKIGVRLHGAGLRDVLAPHEGYMRFVEVPTLERRLHDKKGQENPENHYANNRNFKEIDNSPLVFNYTNYTTLTVEEFQEFVNKNSEYQILLNPEYRYTLVYDKNFGVEEFNLSLYKHYKITSNTNETELIYVSNYETLNQIKNKLWNGEIVRIELDKLSGFDWTTNIEGKNYPHLMRGRHLKPIDFEFVLQNELGQKRIYSIYDCAATEILFLLRENIIAAKEKLKILLLNPKLIKFNISNEEVDLLTEKKFLNYLRSILSFEYSLLKKGEHLSNDEDTKFLSLPNVNFSLENLNTIVDNRFFNAEMVANHPQNYKFGITNRMQIMDVTLDSITEELNRQLGEVDNLSIKNENGKKYTVPLYFMLENGNIYLVDWNTSVQNVLPIDDKFIFVDEIGDSYVQFEPEKPLLKIGESGVTTANLFITYINGVPKLILKYRKETNPLLKNSFLETLLEINKNISQVNKRNPVFVKNDIALEEESAYLNGIDRLDMMKEDLDERDEKYYQSINHLAKAKYSLFQMMLRHATSRIPGQSYQSFSATRITRFLHGESSTCLINDHNIWITGGDYDIDKLFSIGYNLTKQGRFIGWNPFFNDSTYEHLLQSLDLMEPISQITINADDTGVNLSLDSTIPGISNIKLLKMVLYKDKKGLTRQYSNIRYSIFKAFVKLYNDIAEHGVAQTSLDPSVILLLETTVLDNKNVTEALQNRVVLSTRLNFSDERNTVPSFAPISLSLVKDLKLSSFQEKQSKITHPSNPIKQVNDIYNQYTGKNVVGIMASGLKLYATISYVIEKALYQQKDLDELKNMLFSQKVYTLIDSNGEASIRVTNGFAGIHYDLIPESLALLQESLSKLNQEKTLQEIELSFKEDYKNDSVLLAISELLSAATDNGKEMILGIINSGKETLGIYTYALMLGYSLEEIGNIMISEPVSFIVKNLKRSIFLKEPFKNLIDVSAWFLQNVSLESFIPVSAIYNVLSTLNIPNKELFYQKSIDDLKSLIETKKDSLKRTNLKFVSEEEFFYDLNEPETFDAYTSLQNWINTTIEIEKIKNNPESLRKAKVFATLVENALLFTSTVQVLSTNQKVHSNVYDLMRLSISFEDTIRNYVLEVPNPASTEDKPLPNLYLDYHNNGIKQPEIDYEEIKILKNFSMWEFFNDENYAAKLIEIFNKFKADLNPLFVIYKLEHFREMIKVSLLTEQLYKKYSVTYRTLYNFMHSENNNKYNLLSVLEDKTRTAIISLNTDLEDLKKYNGILDSTIKKIVRERHLDVDTFSVLEDIIDDVYIHNSLIVLQELLGENYLRISVDNGTMRVVNLGQHSGNDSVLGRREFVNYVETKLIPAWKMGFLSLDNVDTEINVDLSRNLFVKALHIRDFKVPVKDGENFTAFGVLNYRSTNNQQSKLNQNKLINALYELEGLTIDGVSIVDILFLYNMIVHRGKNGEFTISSFFDPSKHPLSIINKYYQLTNRVNLEIEDLPLSEYTLKTNGFDKDLNFAIKFKNKEMFDTTSYKSIRVFNEQAVLEEHKSLNLSLEQKLNVLSGITNDNNIKFICI